MNIISSSIIELTRYGIFQEINEGQKYFLLECLCYDSSTSLFNIYLESNNVRRYFLDFILQKKDDT